MSAVSIESEISDKLSDVAANRLSVWEFEQWVEPKSWSMHRDLGVQDRKLISSIQSLFTRFDFEGADEAALRDALLSLFRLPQILVAISANVPVSVSISFDPEPYENIPDRAPARRETP